MASIRTNLMAMAGQTNVKRSQASLATSMERLASGSRVNSAKDDPAGQAIANRMTSQIKGFDQAKRNANDGVSLSQTAQSVLDSVNEKLQRIRELTVQGLSEIYNGATGDHIQAEINFNIKEIERLNQVSEYNGIPLLNGSAGKVALQIGANVSDTLNIDLDGPGFDIETLGLKDFVIQGEPGSFTRVNTLPGSSRNILVDDPLTNLSYKPAQFNANKENLNLVRFNRELYVQEGGDSGRLRKANVTAFHDTDTRISDVTLNVTESRIEGTLPQGIGNRSFKDADGNPLPSANTRIVHSNDQYWIERTLEGVSHYTPAELSIDNNTRSVVAQARDDSRISRDDMPSDIRTVNDLPRVRVPQAGEEGTQYSLTLDGQNESTNESVNLVYLTNAYFVEEKMPDGRFSYYPAQVESQVGGEQPTLTVTSQRVPMGPVTDQPDVAGASLVHFKPSNNNVNVIYQDLSGRTYQNVMQPDDEVGYTFDLQSSSGSSSALKKAYIVQDQDGKNLLQTVNGAGEVVLYYPRDFQLGTDVANNITTARISETAEPRRFRNPPDPLATLDRAIAQVDTKRSEFGALDNRLTSIIEGQLQTYQDFSAARSRIEDTDYALEASNMVREQILSQAGTSMLAQANQIPENVLTLLEESNV